MELTYLIYTSLFVFTISFAYLGLNANGRRDNVVLTNKVWVYWGIAVVFYTLLLGLREDIGLDYTSYKYVFKDLLIWGNNANQTDIIFYIFLPLVKNFHYNLFIAFLAFIPIFFLFRNFENKTKILPLYLFFFFVFDFFSSVNLMRQYSSMFVVFFAINQFLKKDYKRFLIYYILAFIIHRSCVVVLPFIFLFKDDFLKWRWLQYVLLFSSIIIGELVLQKFSLLISIIKLPDFLNSYQKGYIESYYMRTEKMEGIMKSLNYRIGPVYFLNLFLNCMAIYFSVSLKERYKNYNFTLFYNFFISGLILTNLLGKNEGLDRILLYFRFYNIFIFAILFSYLFKIKVKHKIILQSICIIIMLLYVILFYKTIATGDDFLQLAPYKFI